MLKVLSSEFNSVSFPAEYAGNFEEGKLQRELSTKSFAALSFKVKKKKQKKPGN